MSSLLAAFGRFTRFLVKIFEWLGTVFFSVMSVMLIVQIFMRRIVNRPFVWAEDLNVLLFVWLTFFGAAALFSRKQLLNVDVLISHISKKAARFIELAVDLVLVAAAAYVLELTMQFLGRQVAMGHKLGGALGIPSWVITAALAASLGSMLLSAVFFTIKDCVAAFNARVGRSLDEPTE